MILFHRLRYFALAGLLLTFMANDQAKATLISVAVSSASDDAEESLGPVDGTQPDSVPGTVITGSSDLELGTDFRTVAGEWRQLIGLRFANVAIPAGATIDNAYIQFTVDETDRNTNTASFTIYGESSSNAATFSDTATNISSRSPTTATSSWFDVPAWTNVGDAGAAQRTSELASIVQEIVDLGGWASGNALAIMIDPAAGNDFSRVAEAYGGGEPVLNIEYTVSVVPEPSTILFGFLATTVAFARCRRSA